MNWKYCVVSVEIIKCRLRNILYYGHLKNAENDAERYLSKGGCENRKRMELAHYRVEWRGS